MEFGFSKKIKVGSIKSHGSYFTMNPEGAWVRIVVGFLFVVIVAAALHIFVFLKINKGEIFLTKGGGEADVQTVDRTKLKETTDYYDAREAMLRAILDAPPHVADPAL